jgi:hypothetical protein
MGIIGESCGSIFRAVLMRILRVSMEDEFAMPRIKEWLKMAIEMEEREGRGALFHARSDM